MSKKVSIKQDKPSVIQSAQFQMKIINKKNLVTNKSYYDSLSLDHPK